MVTEGLEGVGRRFMIPGPCEHSAFPDRDLVDPPLFQKDHHVLNHPGGGNHPPLGKQNFPGPENNVGFDKDL